MNNIKEIPLSNLFISPYNVRTENIYDENELENLANHIEKIGLLEPIIVYSVDDVDESHEFYDSHKELKGKYAILSGQRRFNAFKILNKKYPGSKWDKIPCIVIKPPENKSQAASISFGTSFNHIPLTIIDVTDTCNKIFEMYPDERVVSKKLGIPVSIIKRYVKFARLPKIVQDNIEEIHKNPKTAVNLAVEAADVLEWSKDGDVSDEKVFELAKKLGEKKRISQVEYKKLKQTAEENPKLSISQIEEESLKNSTPMIYSLILDHKTSTIIDSLAKENGQKPEELISDFLTDFIELKFSKN